EELRWASAGTGGSQFRSRDLFPEVAAAIASGRPDGLAEEMPTSEVPDVPAYRFAYADGYGNLKTTIKSGAGATPASGSVVRVEIGGTELEATASDGSFGVEEGELAFAPGSSGWRDASGEEVVWMELFLRGGSAWEEFGRPPLGSGIKVEAST
ncbi:MAG: SAM-dependent chlorinase/fluorinase, partial [Actinomycetota bacterium]|nr:SAM-dependent chlorinase/fluorinase [Actinomycetota bacterium]